MYRFLFLIAVISLHACSAGGENAEVQQSAAKEEPSMKGPGDAFMALFDTVNVVKMHLFASGDPNPMEENYPYIGKPVPADMMNLLPKHMHPKDDRQIYACYFTENSHHYILRTPGKNGTWDLVLATWDEAAGTLKQTSYLAYYICDDTGCTQQDSWLADLDDNRMLELIVRTEKKDPAGNIVEADFYVTTDKGSGNFSRTDEQLASLAVKENYVMKERE